MRPPHPESPIALLRISLSVKRRADNDLACHLGTDRGLEHVFAPSPQHKRIRVSVSFLPRRRDRIFIFQHLVRTSCGIARLLCFSNATLQLKLWRGCLHAEMSCECLSDSLWNLVGCDGPFVYRYLNGCDV